MADEDTLYGAYGRIRSRTANERRQTRSDNRKTPADLEKELDKVRTSAERLFARVEKQDARIAQLEQMNQSLRGANGIKVDLPVISFTGDAGGGGIRGAVLVTISGVLNGQPAYVKAYCQSEPTEIPLP